MDTSHEIADALAASLARHAARIGARPLLAAVSGGIDSTAMALALAGLRASDRLGEVHCHLAHIDHRQHDRNRVAADAVRQLADTLGLRYVERALDLRPGASEDAMRRARYAVLTAIARETGAGTVLTAHHFDDQLETVAMRSDRGTGPRGLAGMPEWRPLSADIGLLRPLLDVRRAHLAAAVRASGTPVVVDPTNRDLRRARARIRHRVLPALRASRGIDDLLARVTARAQRNTAAAESSARRWLAAHATSAAAWRVDLPIPTELGLQARDEVTRLVHVAVSGDAPLRSWIARVLALADARTGTQVGGSVLVERTRGGLLVIDPLRRADPPREPVALQPDGTATPFGATEWTLRAARCDADTSLATTDRSAAIVDAGRIAAPLHLRTARADDLIRLPGTPTPRHLRAAMQRRGIPPHDRDRIPVVVDGSGRCLWAPGLDVAADARVTSSTRVRIRVEVIPAGGIALPDPPYWSASHAVAPPPRAEPGCAHAAPDRTRT